MRRYLPRDGLHTRLSYVLGKHLETKPNSRKSERVADLLKDLLSSVSSALKAPICKSAVELDLRSSLIRVQEVRSFSIE